MILQERTKNEKDLFLIYSKCEEIQKIRRKEKKIIKKWKKQSRSVTGENKST